MTLEEKITSGEEIRRGIDFCKDYILMAMYNANDRTEEDKDGFLSAPELKIFYERVLAELDNFIEKAIIGEPGIDTYDQAALHENAMNTVKERIGF